MTQFVVALTLLLSGTAAGQGGLSSWIPTWRTGDSWTIKELVPALWAESTNAEWRWQYLTYDVQGTTRVGHSDCYALEAQMGRWGDRPPRPKSVFYLRRSDLKVIREDYYALYSGKLLPPVHIDHGEGKAGPFFMTGGSRWPRFPLDSIPQRDTVFLVFTDSLMSDLERQGLSRVAAPTAEHWLTAGDTAGEPVLRSQDSVLLKVLIDEGTYTGAGISPVSYSLQLWSRDLPWRLYEEWGGYPASTAGVYSREWLIQANARRP